MRPAPPLTEDDDDDDELSEWPAETPSSSSSSSSMATILLASPGHSRVETLLRRLHCVLPENKLIGGVVAGSAKEPTSRLFLNGTSYSHGAVAMVMQGAFELDTVCAPCEGLGFQQAAERRPPRSKLAHPEGTQRTHLGYALDVLWGCDEPKALGPFPPPL